MPYTYTPGSNNPNYSSNKLDVKFTTSTESRKERWKQCICLGHMENMEKTSWNCRWERWVLWVTFQLRICHMNVVKGGSNSRLHSLWYALHQYIRGDQYMIVRLCHYILAVLIKWHYSVTVDVGLHLFIRWSFFVFPKYCVIIYGYCGLPWSMYYCELLSHLEY